MSAYRSIAICAPTCAQFAKRPRRQAISDSPPIAVRMAMLTVFGHWRWHCMPHQTKDGPALVDIPERIDRYEVNRQPSSAEFNSADRSAEVARLAPSAGPFNRRF